MLNNITSATAKMPHAGSLLKKYVEKSRLNQTEIARQMGITSGALIHYYQRESIHIHVLWRASLILEHNFFLDIGLSLPLEFSSEKESELKDENLYLKIKLKVYEEIMNKKS